VDAIGLGVNETAVIDQAMAVGRFDCFLLAGRYTLLEQEPLNGFFDRVAAHGARIVAGGVYNSGILATGTRSGQPVTRAHPVIASVLVGLGSADLVDRTLALASTPIPSSFWTALKDEGVIPDNAPVPVVQELQG